MSKTFCIKPWNHAMVSTDGSIKLCCMSSELSEFNIKTHTVSEWWNSEFVSNVRHQMLNGEKPQACKRCHTLETNGNGSLRQLANAEYKIVEKYASKLVTHFGYPTEMPIDFEFALTNLCNLKCLTCTEKSSSSIGVENKILKISNITQSKYDVGNYEMGKIKEILLSKPKFINFSGGETMMVPVIKQLLQWGIDNKVLDDTTVHLTTNGTKVTDEWLEILSNLKNLRVMLSVDGVGNVNEYIRYGSKWDIVESAAEMLSNIRGINFVIHSTLSNLNVLSIGNLIKWCNEHNYFLDLDILTNPEMYRVQVMPAPLLEEAKRRLEVVGGDVVDKIMSAISAPITDGWDELQREITMRDNIRNVSILKIIPELGPYWNAQTK